LSFEVLGFLADELGAPKQFGRQRLGFDV